MNRPELKARAREQMRQARPAPMLVAAVFLLPHFIIYGYEAYRVALWMEQIVLAVQAAGGVVPEVLPTLPDSLPLTLATSAFFLLYSVVEAGFSGYCLRVSRGLDAGLGNLLDFVSDRPVRIIAVNLLVTLAVLPFTVLEMLFGATIFVPLLCLAARLYIMFGLAQAVFFAVDRAELNAADCLRESWRAMRGRRGEYFTLTLSFAGWALACVLLLPVFHLVPYVQVTLAGYFDIITGQDDERQID